MPEFPAFFEGSRTYDLSAEVDVGAFVLGGKWKDANARKEPRDFEFVRLVGIVDAREDGLLLRRRLTWIGQSRNDAVRCCIRCLG